MQVKWLYEASPSSRREWFSTEDGDVLPLKLPYQILALLISQETEQDREKYYLQTQDVALHLYEKQYGFWSWSVKVQILALPLRSHGDFGQVFNFPQL